MNLHCAEAATVAYIPHLQISILRAEPVLHVTFGVFGEAQHEVPLDLQLVDGLNGFMNLRATYTHCTSTIINWL